jgi:hypothetical protein
MIRGRPRADRPRYRSGQLRPVDAGITATQLQRLRAISRDPWLATQVGRMLFLGQLSQTEAEVAWRIGETIGKYDRALGRRRHPASPAYEVGYGRSEDIDTPEQEKRRITAVRRHERLMAEIGYLDPGARTVRDIEDLCVADRVPMVMRSVKEVLGMLAAPLGIRPHQERAVRLGRPKKRG